MQKLYAGQLSQHLENTLAGCYLVFGEEPLQRIEAISALRHAASQQGFSERISFCADAQFDWSQLHNELSAMSLFSSRRVIELELEQSKLSAAGTEQLKQLPSLLNQDIILVIHGERSFSDVSKLSWFKQLLPQAVQVAIYPLDDRQFQQWLQQRARQYQLFLSNDALQLLQHHCAGNLLAARQELEKLALLYNGQQLDAAMLNHFLADHSTFSVFQLTDALLAGKGEDALHRLLRLQQQDTEPVIIAWQLQKEVMQLRQLHDSHETGTSQSDTFKQLAIWPKRQPLYQSALQRLPRKWLDYLIQELAAFDRAYKSGKLPDTNTALVHLCCLFINPVPRVYSLQQATND